MGAVKAWQEFSDLMKALFHTHGMINAHGEPNWEDWHEYVLRKYPVASERALEEFLPSEGRLSSDDWPKQFFYLKSCVRGGRNLPVLNLAFNFDRSWPEIRVRIGLFMPHAEHACVAYGYRFETSEGPGDHDHCHVQPIRAFSKKDDDPLPQSPDWLPTALPTFPLQATGHVELIACMLSSLYGPTAVRDVMSVVSLPSVKRALGELVGRLEFHGTRWQYWLGKERRYVSLYGRAEEKKVRNALGLDAKDKALKLVTREEYEQRKDLKAAKL